MEPVPETVEAINELDPSVDDVDLLAHLVALANRGQEVVPDLVGVSIARLDQGLTFTLVASAGMIAVLDAVQYVAGGPCVDGAHTNQVTEFDREDVLDEKRWRLFAEATAERGVRSTLTLPVLGRERVEGTVNLYAASARAFVGHHEELAEVFGAWAAGAVTNADLGFRTLTEAKAAPQRVREGHVIDVAIGIVAVQLGVDAETALARLRDGAARARVSLSQIARRIVRARERGDREQ
jgi:GAF domain-containing protein